MIDSNLNIVSDLLRWGRERLEKAEIEDSAISAELLMRSLLGLSRAQFILGHDRLVDPKTESEYKALVERRAAREPLQHLIGWVDFYNITLKADRRALIPRPETEILVETVLGMLKGQSSPEILDIGTGSGNIAIAIARSLPGSRLVGLDISPEALQLAEFNATHNGVEDQIKLVRGDILDLPFVRSLEAFDCIVSNPPYVSNLDREILQPEVVDFEPTVALFSGDDPLIFFKTIVINISYILKPGGLLAFEVGMGQARLVAKMMRDNFKNVEIANDLAGIERVVTGIYARPDKQ
ncbi:MAG: protein-(glutamine-N5) methyltransferase, release factor-specific [candidate division Zixibacteria bacterium RBG_16_53_22]|nr:MAG: protein-(glutamine-N5) methyltransferase, release factor-specific [candidate division Zixibacteria bacterium RBG_16_53_22]